MSELRLDPLTGRWVIIAQERARRPADFHQRRLPVEDDPDRGCPFCPDQDADEQPTLETFGPDGRWEVKVVPNRFPALSGSEPMVVTHLGPVHTQAPASGLHEVVVFSPDHEATLADLSPEHAGAVIAAVAERVSQHAAIPGLRYSQAVVNHGREAGASLAHPHGQLLSMPFVPGEVGAEMAGFARFRGNCLLCATLDAEESEDYRVVYADDELIIISPFWAGSPYELLVIPRQHAAHIYQAEPEGLAAVGAGISRVLRSLRDVLGDVAYNLMLHSAPYRVDHDYHWHIHVVPQVTTKGGFELGSGVAINVVAPELAAESLRAGVTSTLAG